MLAVYNKTLHLMQILLYWNRCQADSRKQLIRKQQGTADGILDNWTPTHKHSVASLLPKELFLKKQIKGSVFLFHFSHKGKKIFKCMNGWTDGWMDRWSDRCRRNGRGRGPGRAVLVILYPFEPDTRESGRRHCSYILGTEIPAILEPQQYPLQHIQIIPMQKEY